ncbi:MULTISPECIES: C-GCAxxG-C-C family protein [unclassified Pyramidobacter]|uniref:C-GCAxxG-C-C family protein n=1 Tax=unclassified Pyramidobacter TaxID=2632171 RepID=UPI00098F697E|nr:MULTISPECIES: C-GCAxxG-C-C family protein [unclassified Pyramidobacter]RKJ77889.1 C_GCAxxG_C_C family protein [Pyramidobacter sp. CG50-2]WOL40288.1 C-GCAxxG-C-C family protein [Pyramidobacter sp. YE332]
MHDGSKECQCGARAGADRWLENLDALVGELNADQRFCCSQTVLAIGMRRLGIDDPDLLRAMEGFCGGACGGTCGALAGGAALMGLYLGKGTAREPRSETIRQYVRELTETFRAYWKGTTCESIVHGDAELRRRICPNVIAGAVEMVWSILGEHGLDLDRRKIDRMPRQ